MTMDRMIAAAERVCAAAGVADGTVDTGVARLAIARRPALSPLEAMIYEPLVCFVLQGAKDTGTQGGGVRASAGRMLVVSHDVPIVSRIVEATPHRPYIALILPLDLSILRELVSEVDEDRAGGTGRAMTLHEADDPLCDAFARLLDLVERPGEAGVLGPLVQREIHYRLLVSPQGRRCGHCWRAGPPGRSRT